MTNIALAFKFTGIVNLEIFVVEVFCDCSGFGRRDRPGSVMIRMSFFFVKHISFRERPITRHTKAPLTGVTGDRSPELASKLSGHSLTGEALVKAEPRGSLPAYGTAPLSTATYPQSRPTLRPPRPPQCPRPTPRRQPGAARTLLLLPLLPLLLPQLPLRVSLPLISLIRMRSIRNQVEFSGT